MARVGESAKRKGVSPTLWGISAAPECECSSEILEMKHMDLVERTDFVSLESALSISTTFWSLVANEAVERRERQELIQSLCVEFKAIACVVGLSRTFLDRSDAEFRVLEFIKNWEVGSTCAVFFDTGKIGPPPWLAAERCVSDPLWFKGQIWGSYWKIHGWHDVRWVRMYSESELKELVRSAAKYKPQCVILAHSQRVQQLSIVHRLARI